MVPPGCKSESGVHFEGRLHSPVKNKTPTSERPSDNQWLCKPPQEPLPEGAFACSDQQEGSREGNGSDLSSLFQQTVSCPQTKSEMASNLRSQCSEQIFQCKNIQDGDSRDNPYLSAERGSSLDFSDTYFHIPVHNRYLRFHFQNQTFPFRALPFGLSTAPMEFTLVVKEVKLLAQSRGIRIHQYLDYWVIRAPTRESCHQGTQSLLALCQELGWVVNLQKLELEPKQVFEFVDY